MSFYKGRKTNGLQAHYIENKAAIAILYNYHSQENESSKQWLRVHKFKTFHLVFKLLGIHWSLSFKSDFFPHKSATT